VANYKIVVSGPVGAGKSTSIRSVSDDLALTTDVAASDITGVIKEVTTIALDHGAFDLPGGDRVALFGTPGQDRFDFMWEILSEGASGLVLLIPNDHLQPLAELRLFVKAFAPLIGTADIAVGVTHTDRSDLPSLDDYRRTLADLGLPHSPVTAVDARRPDDVRALILTLLSAHRAPLPR
jgi:hypothetical protein